jgi:DNA-binding CsgD family transcriptional regulator
MSNKALIQTGERPAGERSKGNCGPMNPSEELMISVQTAEPAESVLGTTALHEWLTPHERRIVSMLAEGRSYLEMAERLGVTVNTIRNYIRSSYRKLDVHTKSEAVSKALRGRLIT